MFDFLKEYDQQSLTRIMSIVLLLFFMVVTIYLIYARFDWSSYEIFCVVTVGSGAGSQLFNKYINSKYNTNLGSAGKPLNSGNNKKNNNGTAAKTIISESTNQNK